MTNDFTWGAREPFYFIKVVPRIWKSSSHLAEQTEVQQPANVKSQVGLAGLRARRCAEALGNDGAWSAFRH